MPAYRSTDEADIRDAVVARLRLLRPAGRIIHEIQNATWGPNRIDVLCVSDAEIIAVEVKSRKDKLDRLPKQITAMRGCAHHVIAALHEKFLTPMVIRGEAKADTLLSPMEADGAVTWAWPEAGVERGRTYRCAAWLEPDLKNSLMKPLPHTALDMLWAGELRKFCRNAGVVVGAKSTRPAMMTALRWNLSGRDLTQGICAALRRRDCPEADPPLGELER